MIKEYNLKAVKGEVEKEFIYPLISGENTLKMGFRA